MKHPVLNLRTLICMLAFSSTLFAQEPPAAERPSLDPPALRITPANPVAGRDDVAMQIVLGVAANRCFAPSYRDIAFVIDPEGRDRDDGTYLVKVRFTGVPVADEQVCPRLYDPVAYGPEFSLGALRGGIYTVVDAEEGAGGLCFAAA